MNKPKFTKGEWRLSSRTSLNQGYLQVYAENGATDSTVMIYGREYYNSNEQAVIANAHLIKASPKMYHLLNDIVTNYECGEIIDRQILKLLAEARGES